MRVGFGGYSPDGLPQGGAEATAAVSASMFHLFTHAFFKALLFLAAGSVMHAMGNVIDMGRFSGLRKVLPTTHWTFLIGALPYPVCRRSPASGARTRSSAPPSMPDITPYTAAFISSSSSPRW